MSLYYVVVQLLFLCDSMDGSIPVSSVLYCLSEFAQIHVHYVGMLPNHLLLPSSPLPSVFPSIRVFSNETALWIRWPKYCSFSFSISLFMEYSGLISFRINWFDLLAVQGTLRSLLQHRSSKASILQCSAFFVVQLSHLYMTAGKTIALTRQTFVGKVMSLLLNMLFKSVILFLNMLSRFVIAFLTEFFLFHFVMYLNSHNFRKLLFHSVCCLYTL